MFWLDLCNLWRQPCFQCMQPLPNNIYSTIPCTYIALQTAWCVQWTLQLPVINGSGTFFPLTYSLASLSPKAAPVCLQVFEGTLSNPLLFFLLSCSSTFWHLSGLCRKKHFWLFRLGNWGPSITLGYSYKSNASYLQCISNLMDCRLKID